MSQHLQRRRHYLLIYQIATSITIGRVVAGTGAPSYVSLNPIAFNGLAIPNREVVFGTGPGVTSTSNFQFTTGNSLKIGTGTVTGAYGINMGGGSNASNYVLNIGGGIVNNRGNNSLIISESGSEISGSGNANLSVLIGGNNNKVISDYAAYGSVLFGTNNTITSITKSAIYNRILGISNTITEAYYCNILGVSNNITASGAYTGYYNDIIGNNNNITTTVGTAYGHKIIGSENTVDSGGYVNILGRYCNNGGYSGVMLLSDGGSSTLTATANHQFAARFYGGYRLMKDGSTQWMAIANTGYVTINNIPTAASATDILVSNGGVVSTRTVASLGIPVITPAALTKTDDTNVTLTLGGTPGTALLQNVSLTLGWNGVLAISRGGTGLGTLGTANQVLRVNAGGTALEYATLTDLDAQTLTWTKATSNLAISNGNSVNLFNLTSLTSGDLIKWDGTDWVNFTPTWTTNTGTVTSVAASISGTAIVITGSPITTYGTLDFTWMGSIYQYVRGDGSLATFPSIPSITPSALTKTDDTNVTLTLGGTPGTALLQNVSLTLGWTGVLAISRGGTGLGTLGTANQLLRVNSSATALEYFTPDWTSNTGTVTSFSAGNLSPLFTTNVATPTTTPALSFNLSNCNQYQVFGREVS